MSHFPDEPSTMLSADRRSEKEEEERQPQHRRRRKPYLVAIAVMGIVVAVVIVAATLSNNNNSSNIGTNESEQTAASGPIENEISDAPSEIAASPDANNDDASPLAQPTSNNVHKTSTPSAETKATTLSPGTDAPSSTLPTMDEPSSWPVPVIVTTTDPEITTFEPTIITPIEVQATTKLVAGDGAANDNFGYDVAVDGDTLVVGARFDDDDDDNDETNVGSAYVYVKQQAAADGGSRWTQQAKLRASDDNAADGAFGYSVDVSGHTIVVSAPQHQSVLGAVYVFVRPNVSSDATTELLLSGDWTQQAKLVAVDGVEGDEFGRNVVVDGDTIAVGNRFDDDVGNDGGTVFVFERINASWTQQAKLLASDGVAMDRFGFGLGIQRDTIVAGAYWDDGNRGAAYVFGRTSDDNTWTEQSKLTASDGEAGDEFAISLGIDGDTLVLGAWRSDAGGNGNGRSCAYVFARSGATWTEQTKLFAKSGSAENAFGRSVAISGNIIVVGAYKHIVNTIDSGAAFVFSRSSLDDNWSEVAKVVPGDGNSEQRFGFDVGANGDSIVIGANWDDENGSNSGSVYLIDRNQLSQ